MVELAVQLVKCLFSEVHMNNNCPLVANLAILSTQTEILELNITKYILVLPGTAFYISLYCKGCPKS